MTLDSLKAQLHGWIDESQDQGFLLAMKELIERQQNKLSERYIVLTEDQLVQLQEAMDEAEDQKNWVKHEDFCSVGF